MTPRPKGTLGPGRVIQGGATRRGTYWVLDFADATGARRRRRFYGSKRAAQLQLTRLVAARDSALVARAVHVPGLLFGEVVRSFMEDMRPRVGPRHARETEAGLLRLQEQMTLVNFGDLTLTAINAYRERRLGRAPRPSNRTVNLELAYLRAICNWALQTGLIETNPIAGYKALPQGRGHKKTKRTLSEEKLGRLLGALRVEDSRLGNRFPVELIVRGLMLTGMRYGAFRALTRADWSGSESLLVIGDHIVKTGQGRQLKADSPQAGGLDRVIRESLEVGARFLGRVPRPEDPIWLWQRGKQLPPKPRVINGVLDRALAAIGEPKETSEGVFSVHALRHTCVTRFARFGVTLPRAQYWVGHASLRMTQGIYTHIESGDLKHATDGVVPWLAGSFLAANPSYELKKEEA